MGIKILTNVWAFKNILNIIIGSCDFLISYSFLMNLWKYSNIWKYFHLLVPNLLIFDTGEFIKIKFGKFCRLLLFVLNIRGLSRIISFIIKRHSCIKSCMFFVVPHFCFSPEDKRSEKFIFSTIQDKYNNLNDSLCSFNPEKTIPCILMTFRTNN